jgi:uncharacterized membrane protein
LDTLQANPSVSQLLLRRPHYGGRMDRGYGIQQFPQGGMRGGFVEHAGHNGGPHALAWMIFALLLAVLLVALVSLLLDLYHRSQGGGNRPFGKWLPPGFGPGGGGGGAVAVLDLRYARGELSRKDYLQARDDLGASREEEDEVTTEVQAPPPRRPRKTES